MKKFILLAVLTAIQFCSFGQNTMKFLGIPIDGSKTQMIEALKNKGYSYDRENDFLEGEFNGQNVNISVVTNNNRVYRIYVINHQSVDESQIKINFNNLYYQFSKNGKYEHISGEILSDKEDISYEITVHNKNYDMAFVPVDKSINGMVWYRIIALYGKYYIAMFYDNLNNQANGEDL